MPMRSLRKIVVDIDRQALRGQVTDVPNRGLDIETVPQKARDGARFGRGLHDHKGFRHAA